MDLGFSVSFDTATALPNTDALYQEWLVSANTALVRRIAWHVHGRMSSAIDVEDLQQIGMMALVVAARTFVDRGEAAFSTYAAVRIRGAMIDELRRHATLCRSALKRRREIADARSAVEGAVGRAATEGELASRLGLTVEAYRAVEAQTHAHRQESMDEVYSDHSIWFADDAPDAAELLDRERLQARLADVLATLPRREQQVLHFYFIEGLNLDEIGRVLGVGGARVCQLKRAALDKVRARLGAYAC